MKKMNYFILCMLFAGARLGAMQTNDTDSTSIARKLFTALSIDDKAEVRTIILDNEKKGPQFLFQTDQPLGHTILHVINIEPRPSSSTQDQGMITRHLFDQLVKTELRDQKDLLGRTPLMGAVFDGQEHKVRSLLAAGADVNACDRHGSTVLDRALAAGRPEMIRLLISSPNIDISLESIKRAVIMADQACKTVELARNDESREKAQRCAVDCVSILEKLLARGAYTANEIYMLLKLINTLISQGQRVSDYVYELLDETAELKRLHALELLKKRSDLFVPQDNPCSDNFQEFIANIPSTPLAKRRSSTISYP